MPKLTRTNTVTLPSRPDGYVSFADLANRFTEDAHPHDALMLAAHMAQDLNCWLLEWQAELCKEGGSQDRADMLRDGVRASRTAGWEVVQRLAAYKEAQLVLEAALHVGGAFEGHMFALGLHRVSAHSPVPAKPSTWTYLCRKAGGSLFKIGRSTNVEARLKALSIGAGCQLELVGTLPVDMKAELHREFASARVFGEWFCDDDGAIVERFIALHKELGPSKH